MPNTAGPIDAELEASRRSSFLDGWVLVTCYSGLYVVISLLVNHYVLTSEIVDRAWIEAGLVTELEAFAERRDKWRLYGYLLMPLFVLAKIGFTAVCIAIGCALAYWEIDFVHLFRVSAQAEIVWAVVAVIHVVYVLFVLDVETMLDYSGFYPLSALNLVTIGDGDLWAVYLLKTLNVFEIGYVAMLVEGVRHLVRTSIADVAFLVLLSYGSGTLLLVAAVTFALMAFT